MSLLIENKKLSYSVFQPVVESQCNLVNPPNINPRVFLTTTNVGPLLSQKV
jgi:hypothetical protein